MKQSQDDCARLERLLARMEDASGAPAHRADPTDALTPDDLAWAATHVDGCPRCTAAAAVETTVVGDALRALDEPLPGAAFFAARRTTILAAIAAHDAAGHVTARPVPRLVALRPAARAADPAHRRSAAPRPPLRVRRRRLVAPAALAALLVIGLATALLRPAGDVVLESDAPEVPVALVATAPLDDALASDEPDDAWLVASTDLFGVALAVPTGDPLASLSDAELEEIEDVFLAAPGWS